MLLRLWYLNKVEQFPITLFLNGVIGPVALTTLLASVVPLIFKCIFYDGSIASFIISICLCVCSFIISVFLVGLSREEKALIISKIKK